MHPAYSVIVFTTASGAGLGLLVFLGLGPLFGIAPSGALGWSGFIVAFALAVGGLLSSTLHLRRPERAWRAFSQWRSSWLSREGVLAVAALAAGGFYAIGALLGDGASPALGVLTAALSLATVYATAMIYVQLKSVQRWRTPLTVVCYLGFSLAGGGLLFAALAAMAGAGGAGASALFATILLIAAWGAKHLWWRHGDAAAALSTPESATGLGGIGRVRLLESPHTNRNYLLTEMGYAVARKHRDKLRLIAFALGGAAPAVASLMATSLAWPSFFLAIAVATHLAGVLTERWLFFAEAEHAVMNYYKRG